MLPILNNHCVQKMFPTGCRIRLTQVTGPQNQVPIMIRSPVSRGEFIRLPLQRQAPYQDNGASYYSNSTATHQYTPSVLQTQPPCASYQQLSLQGRQYQDTSVAHSSNPANPVQYTTSNYSQLDVLPCDAPDKIFSY